MGFVWGVLRYVLSYTTRDEWDVWWVVAMRGRTRVDVFSRARLAID